MSSSGWGHLPSMEGDRRWPMDIKGWPTVNNAAIIWKMRTKGSYVYQKWFNDDLRPLSTSSNVHRSSSIIFHWWKMTSTWKVAEIEVISIQSDPNVISRPFSTSSNVHGSSSIDVASIMETFWPARLKLSQLIDPLVSVSKGVYLNPSSLMRTSTCESFNLPGQIFPFQNQLNQWKMTYKHWKMRWKVLYHVWVALDIDHW